MLCLARGAIEFFLHARNKGLRIGGEIQVELSDLPLDLSLGVRVLRKLRLLDGISVLNDHNPWVVEWAQRAESRKPGDADRT